MNSKNLKLLIIIPLVISVLAAIFTIIMFYKGDETVASDAGAQAVTIVPLFYLTYFVLGIATLAALVFFVVQIIKGTVDMKKLGIGLRSFILVIVISYVMASDTVPVKFAETISSSTTKWVGAGLIMFYLLLALSVLGIIYSEVSRLFK